MRFVAAAGDIVSGCLYEALLVHKVVAAVEKCRDMAAAGWRLVCLCVATFTEGCVSDAVADIPRLCVVKLLLAVAVACTEFFILDALLEVLDVVDVILDL